MVAAANAELLGRRKCSSCSDVQQPGTCLKTHAGSNGNISFSFLRDVISCGLSFLYQPNQYVWTVGFLPTCKTPTSAAFARAGGSQSVPIWIQRPSANLQSGEIAFMDRNFSVVDNEGQVGLDKHDGRFLPNSWRSISSTSLPRKALSIFSPITQSSSV